MKNFKSHFTFNKQERSGIFFLLLIIISLQCIYLVMSTKESSNTISVDGAMQSKIDSLKALAASGDSTVIRPFNPNFITDYKGYTLGMSPQELDRLHLYRSNNNYVNSAKDFQEITGISDSLLVVISPYFKFPEWTQERSRQSVVGSSKNTNEKVTPNYIDLNLATKEELMTVSGIGEKFSARIIKFRDALGGFLVDDQLNDVYGLEPNVVARTLQKFRTLDPPNINKIAINQASESEIAELVYISRTVARNIVAFRQRNGSFNSLDELTEIEDFPAEKIERIKLYLTL